MFVGWKCYEFREMITDEIQRWKWDEKQDETAKA